MKKAGLVLLGALPGAAAGYLLLTGYLLGRVRPVPIGLIPQPAAVPAVVIPPMYRRPASPEAELPRERAAV